MGGTDSIDIILFHNIKVLSIPLLRHRPALIHIKVVAVNTPEHKRHTVEINLFALYFNLLEADLIGLDLIHLSPHLKRHNKSVCIRRFSRPFLRRFYSGFKAMLFASARKLELLLAERKLLTRRRNELCNKLSALL